MLISIISQGLIWAILGLGILMTFRILDFPDMTTEGSFPLGGAVAVTDHQRDSSFTGYHSGCRRGNGAGALQVFFIPKGRFRRSLLSGFGIPTAQSFSL